MAACLTIAQSCSCSHSKSETRRRTDRFSVCSKQAKDEASLRMHTAYSHLPERCDTQKEPLKKIEVRRRTDRFSVCLKQAKTKRAYGYVQRTPIY